MSEEATGDEGRLLGIIIGSVSLGLIGLMIIVLGLLLSGCSTLQEITEGPLNQPAAVTVVQPAVAPAKPAIIAECKANWQSGVLIKKTPGGTPVEATEQALLENAKRLQEMSIANRRCFCFLTSNELVVGYDKKQADKVCKSPQKAKTA